MALVYCFISFAYFGVSGNYFTYLLLNFTSEAATVKFLIVYLKNFKKELYVGK